LVALQESFVPAGQPGRSRWRPHPHMAPTWRPHEGVLAQCGRDLRRGPQRSGHRDL